MTDLTSIYKCEAFIDGLERIAAENNGEIPEEKLEALVLAQTTSIAKLEGVVGFLSYCNEYIDTGQAEIERIHGLMNDMKKRRDSCKAYITPYVDHQRQKLGRPLDVGMHRVSTRRSTSVVITDPEGFKTGQYESDSRKKVTYEPDKAKLKEYCEKHKCGHPGAELQEKINLVIK